jgi:putative aldouronate transport system permease protein
MHVYRFMMCAAELLTEVKMKYKSVSRKIFIVFDISLLLILSISCVLPFIHLLAVSFSSSTAVAAGEVGLFPVDMTVYSYEYALKGGRFLRALWVSCKRVFLGVGLNLILMVLTAYPLSKSKERMKGRNLYMLFFVITMLISGGMIPTYLVVVRMGLKNSIWSLILPGAIPVYQMIILMNFMRGLPAEVEEAARIDGAGSFCILLRIILPLLKPALATVGLFSVVGHWNEWFSGMIYMSHPENYPLQTYLQTLLVNFEQIMQNSGSADYMQLLSKMNVRTGRAAQLFLAALPVMCLYPFLQKFFTKGLVVGSVKG